MVGESGVHGQNHWPAASHWQTLSHNVVYHCHEMVWKNTIVNTEKLYNFLLKENVQIQHDHTTVHTIITRRPLTQCNPSAFKLTQLLSVQNIKELNNLGKYLYVAEKIRNS
jgi:hypothetical protein